MAIESPLYFVVGPKFAHFLLDETTWRRKTSANPTRGFEDDGETVPETSRRTAAQKVTHLELMLGQIANLCPVVSQNTIVKNSVSMQSIWQAIRAHFGFQSTGTRFLDFNNIRLEPGERPEDLYQRLVGLGLSTIIYLESMAIFFIMGKILHLMKKLYPPSKMLLLLHGYA